MGSSNPSLSPKGLRQSISLVESLLRLSETSHRWSVLASPKIRTQLTVIPLCEKQKVPLRIEEGLDERQGDEVVQVFRRRVSETLERIIARSKAQKTDFVLVCSHLDWLEECMYALECDLTPTSPEWPQHWDCAQFWVFENQDSLWQFRSQGASRDTN